MNRFFSVGIKFMRPLISSQALKCNMATPTLLSVMKPPTSNFNLVISRSMANHRHKKMIKLAKGYRGRANRCYKIAKLRVMKARQYSYRDRKVKKREFRKLWIQRVNASCRIYGIKYASFIHGMYRSNVLLNRKVLADMAITEPLTFRSIVCVVQESLDEKYAEIAVQKAAKLSAIAIQDASGEVSKKTRKMKKTKKISN